MSIGNIFKNGAWVFAGSGTFTLTGLSNVSINPGLKTISEVAAGQVSPSFIATMHNEPMITGTCSDVGTAITGGFSPSLALPTSTTITTLSVYGTAAAQGGTIGGASTHFKTVVNKGLAVMKSISCSQNGKAQAHVEIHTVFDGTNNPLVYSTGVSLPATPAITQLFSLGPVEVNGSALSGITNVELDFGVSVKKESSDGDVYPTYAYIDKFHPRITLTCKDSTQLSTLTLQGTAQGATASVLYFTALAANGCRIANATTSHIKITVNASQGLIYADNASLNPDTGECKIIIEPIVGSSAVVSLSAASAIT